MYLTQEYQANGHKLIGILTDLLYPSRVYRVVLIHIENPADADTFAINEIA